MELNPEREELTSSATSDTDVGYTQAKSSETHFPSKRELDDLTRDLGLTKSTAELLTSRLNDWNLLGNDSKITVYRKKHLDFSVRFDVLHNPCYCKDVNGFFNAAGIEHDPNQW